MQFDDRVVVVTGSTGIAAAAATSLAAAGARVFVVGIDPDSCDSLRDAISTDGGECEATVADLTDEGETVAAFNECLLRFGRISGLLAVAGASGRRFGDGPLDQIPLTGWEQTFRINANPAFLAAREAVRAMIDADRGGSVVLISSVLATRPSPRMFPTHAYAAVKGAENALIRTMAAYYAERRIRVNGIAPGVVATPMSPTPMSRRAATDPATVEYVMRKQPLVGGLLEPGDIADAALFLLSDQSRAVTGQIIEVDGGWGVTDVST